MFKLTREFAGFLDDFTSFAFAPDDKKPDHIKKAIEVTTPKYIRKVE